MAGDSQDSSRRKHRRLTDDESEDSSKRRKHRHHHRRHRDHRHSSRKREGEDDISNEKEHKLEAEIMTTLPTGGMDYDMEEGEIVDDVGALKVRLDSDVDYGEIKVAEVLAKSENLTNTGVNGANTELAENIVKDGLHLKGSQEAKNNNELLVGFNIDVKVKAADGSTALNKIHEHYMNGDTGLESVKESYVTSAEPQSPVKTRNKRKKYYRSEDDFSNHSKSMSSESSPCEERHRRDKPRSHDGCRERSWSHGNVDQASIPVAAQDRKNTSSDSEDNDNISERGKGTRHHSRDIFKDKERERSSSYSLYPRRSDRHLSHEDSDWEREGSWDGQDRDKEGKDMGRDRRHERNKERGKEKEERERYRERQREKESDRRQERHKERDKGKLERDRARQREKERERERDECERKRQRDSEWEREREDREWRREREDRDHKSEREWQTGRDKSGVNERDREADRNSRHHKNEKVNQVDRNRKSDSKHRQLDEKQQSDKDEENRREENETEDYEEKFALQLVDQEEEDLKRIKEESRRRMQAILEKYKAKPSVEMDKPQSEDSEKEHAACFPVDAAGDRTVLETSDGRVEGVYNNVDGPSLDVGKSPLLNEVSTVQKTSGAGALGEGSPKSERSHESFCDDIFGDSPAGVRKTARGDGIAVERSDLHDNWDDADGYYSYRVGELLDGRYEVSATHGRGVFSTVVRARDLRAGPGDPEEVAIKILRNREAMHKAGKEELIILNKLVGADPENRRHCVRYLSSFKYRNHLCLVFESLHMNLREVLKKFGRNIGLKLTAVRAYSKQLFIALKHLKNCGVLHCDIKPDNMLVNEAKNVLKLCDFGNAMFAGKNEITPYLVSRFYRSPEIILGLPYDHPMDMWSVGCCLFELYSGKVLFPGSTNNDMLRLHMELKGPFPKKMLKKGGFTEQHFDQDLNFLAIEEDPVTKKTMRRLIPPSMKLKDIGTIVCGSPGEDPKMLANFKDLLEKMFVLDPEKRLTVAQALSHPFITGKHLFCLCIFFFVANWEFQQCVWHGGCVGLSSLQGSFRWNVFCSIEIFPCASECNEATMQCFRCIEKTLWRRSLPEKLQF
ncbi:serine/threonine-protein kinase prpf4B-like isoform X2 [Impatiens glandulifera]|uniref:serine/threonine-protein kinase prpf4B-like isoform X2 n=1 Tax=Impatiens glandulifera TaxID=253017 RepID=UPI001FB06A8B|nr:serine/threonine-protein kinase prpf4B-like isoform X2 [Impatiens glandulifera]